jgi:hypothetical protein
MGKRFEKKYPKYKNVGGYDEKDIWASYDEEQ